jgi:hypothetical protein
VSEDHPPIGENDPVPKLPRGKGISLTGPQMFRIGVYGIMLVGIIVMARPCGESAARFMGTFDEGDAGVEKVDKPRGPVLPPGTVRITPDMTDEERMRAIGAAQDAGAPASAGVDAGTE